MCTIAVAKKGHNKSSFFVNRKLYSLRRFRSRNRARAASAFADSARFADSATAATAATAGVSVSAVPVSEIERFSIVVRFSGIEFLLVTRS